MGDGLLEVEKEEIQASWRGGGTTAIIPLLCNPSLPGRGRLRWGPGPPHHGREAPGGLDPPPASTQQCSCFGGIVKS